MSHLPVDSAAYGYKRRLLLQNHITALTLNCCCLSTPYPRSQQRHGCGTTTSMFACPGWLRCVLPRAIPCPWVMSSQAMSSHKSMKARRYPRPELDALGEKDRTCSFQRRMRRGATHSSLVRVAFTCRAISSYKKNYTLILPIRAPATLDTRPRARVEEEKRVPHPPLLRVHFWCRTYEEVGVRSTHSA